MSQENQDRALGESLEQVRQDEERARRAKQQERKEALQPEPVRLDFALVAANAVFTEQGVEVTIIIPKEAVYVEGGDGEEEPEA